MPEQVPPQPSQEIAATAPEYWDGYILGKTGPDTVAKPHIPLSKQWEAAEFAHDSLRTYLSENRNYKPDRRLAEFNAHEYQPGTIVLIQHERVKAPRFLPPATRSTLINIVERCTGNLTSQGTTPQLAPMNPKRAVVNGALLGDGHYVSRLRWGVVVPGKNGNFLMSRGISPIRLGPEGQKLEFGHQPFLDRHVPSSFAVGEVLGKAVHHSKAGRPSTDYYQRIAAIELAGYGNYRRTPRARRALGHLGLHPGNIPHTA